jgi:5-methylcytosine-specific restriction enzyme B
MNYWTVGAAHGNTDVSKDFLDKGIWYDGYAEDGDDRNRSTLNEVEIGDLILMKSSSTKGANHSITFTKLKGLGKVISKKDYHYFKVKWFGIDELPKDFNGISYRKTIEPLREDEMLKFALSIIEKEKRDMIIDLLKYKNQIILQGPPGTGKTRQAKLIAEELTKPRTVGNPERIIDDLVKNFNPNDDNIKASRDKKEKLLSKFYELFPKESLNKLTLESYCAGKGDRDNFCWWIERGLKPLGYYFPGSARAYLIFWKKGIEDYSKHGIVKDIEDNKEAMKKVAELIYEVVQTKNTDNAVKYFGDSFLLKLLNTYYPDEYFPINSERMIDNALKIFKVNYQGLNVFEKNKKLNQVYLEKKKQFNNHIHSYEFGELLWENFNLKTGEDISVNDEAIATGAYEIIQFHPGYSYEDFVRGIVAETTENGNVKYSVVNKILADFSQKATDNPNGNYVLIIDEINRANLPSVLGELIYALEYRNSSVASMYEYEGEREITLPKNLYIIGTMNTADRSVGHIDYALRRRFAFFDVLPDENVIQNPTAKKLFHEIETLFSNDFLSPDFKANDVKIGHSYFLIHDHERKRLNLSDNEIIKIKLEYEIKPILREYLKDGVFLETVDEKIEELNV